MNIFLKYQLVFLFSFAFVNLEAQSSYKIYNSEFILFKENFQIRNPSYGVQDAEKKHFFQFGNKSLNAVSKNVRSFGAISTLNLSSQENKNLWLNINLLREEEGVFINQNRLQTGIIKGLNIKDKSILYASLNIGFINYSVDGNGVVDGRNSFSPDGAFGLKLCHKKIHLGLSATQLFGGEFILYKNKNLLVRQYYTSFGKDFDFVKTKLSLDAYARLPNEINDFSFWFNSCLSVHKNIQTSLLIKDLSAAVPSISILTPVKKSEISFQIAYQIPINIYPKTLNTNQLEILLKLKI
jgi:hypothetical protein